MEKKTVKSRIFISNALMILITLAIFFAINFAVIKVYSESIEHEFKNSIENIVDKHELEEMIKEWTIHRNSFILLFALDGVLCITALVVTSQIFTRKLVKDIMKPLNALGAGAERIRNNELTQNIEYVGDAEFENVCSTFNNMQNHILEEQRKNEKYEKARTDMIAGISHDLRTPLTAIRGTIKGLIDGVASTKDKQDKFLEAAYRRTGDMDILLNQLFYLSKLETGNMPISFQTINIVSFIENYIKGKKELFKDKNIDIIEEINEINVDVSVDPEQLQRVFDNLIENSIKYSESEILKIKISINIVKYGVCICFSDNGVGVPSEKLSYIFDEFYRGDESRSRKEGNGLGLYIVKYLIEAMKGKVRAESINGFSIYIELPTIMKR